MNNQLSAKNSQLIVQQQIW